MASIGPQLPAHLLQKQNEATSSRLSTADSVDEEDDDYTVTIGPALPAHLMKREYQPAHNNEQDHKTSAEDEEEEDAYGPALPPNFEPSRASQKEPINRTEKRVLGPSLPTHGHSDDDEDEEEDVGPKPNLAYIGNDDDGVREFMEKEERRRKEVEVISYISVSSEFTNVFVGCCEA